MLGHSQKSIFYPMRACLSQKISHAYPIKKNLIYKYLSSKKTYIYALPPTIYSSLTHNAIDISHD